MSLQKGICGHCNEKLEDPGAIGYHHLCAMEVFAEMEKKQNTELPFVILDAHGIELERFSNESEARDYLWAIRHSTLEYRR